MGDRVSLGWVPATAGGDLALHYPPKSRVAVMGFRVFQWMECVNCVQIQYLDPSRLKQVARASRPPINFSASASYTGTAQTRMNYEKFDD